MTAVTPADKNHQVVSLVSPAGAPFTHQRKPCEQCPWRRDSPRKAFPAEAYRISAHTAYDMNGAMFSCHMAGKEHPAICAGFLLRGADHNMGVRMAAMTGRYDWTKVSDGGAKLYSCYAAMAIANGVKPNDPALRNCR